MTKDMGERLPVLSASKSFAAGKSIPPRSVLVGKGVIKNEKLLFDCLPNTSYRFVFLMDILIPGDHQNIVLYGYTPRGAFTSKNVSDCPKKKMELENTKSDNTTRYFR